MNSFTRLAARSALLLAALLLSGTAFAQATRTWVSGVGDDANPCSRTAPCKTFAGAISKTAAGGEISVLDPGGYGAVTITKSITINGDGTLAGILNAGTNAVVINAAATDEVILRNLSINGAGTGTNGVRILAAGQVHIQNLTISGITGSGIDIEPSIATKVFISNTTVENLTNAAANGVLVKPGAQGKALVQIDNTRLIGNNRGLRVEDRSTVSVRDSVISGNPFNGITVIPASALPADAAEVYADNNQLTGNGNGDTSGAIKAVGTNARVTLSNNSINGNTVGLVAGTGEIVSFGNNDVSDNGTDGVPDSTIPQR